MSDVVIRQDKTPTWPQRLVRLWLITAFCLVGMNSAQATAEFDPYSHNISLATAVSVCHAPDNAHLWDTDTAILAGPTQERVYTPRPLLTPKTTEHPQPLAAFTARAPPATPPHLQISVS